MERKTRKPTKIPDPKSTSLAYNLFTNRGNRHKSMRSLSLPKQASEWARGSFKSLLKQVSSMKLPKSLWAGWRRLSGTNSTFTRVIKGSSAGASVFITLLMPEMLHQFRLKHKSSHAANSLKRLQPHDLLWFTSFNRREHTLLEIQNDYSAEFAVPPSWKFNETSSSFLRIHKTPHDKHVSQNLSEKKKQKQPAPKEIKTEEI